MVILGNTGITIPPLTHLQGHLACAVHHHRLSPQILNQICGSARLSHRALNKHNSRRKRWKKNIWEQDFTWTPAYLSHLDVGVFYGVGVTFDELFHLPQMSLLDFLKLLLEHTQTEMVRQEKPLLYGSKTLVWGLRFKSYLIQIIPINKLLL